MSGAHVGGEKSRHGAAGPGEELGILSPSWRSGVGQGRPEGSFPALHTSLRARPSHCCFFSLWDELIAGFDSRNSGGDAQNKPAKLKIAHTGCCFQDKDVTRWAPLGLHIKPHHDVAPRHSIPPRDGAVYLSQVSQTCRVISASPQLWGAGGALGETPGCGGSLGWAVPGTTSQRQITLSALSQEALWRINFEYCPGAEAFPRSGPAGLTALVLPRQFRCRSSNQNTLQEPACVLRLEMLCSSQWHSPGSWFFQGHHLQQGREPFLTQNSTEADDFNSPPAHYFYCAVLILLCQHHCKKMSYLPVLAQVCWAHCSGSIQAPCSHNASQKRGQEELDSTVFFFFPISGWTRELLTESLTTVFSSLSQHSFVLWQKRHHQQMQYLSVLELCLFYWGCTPFIWLQRD